MPLRWPPITQQARQLLQLSVFRCPFLQTSCFQFHSSARVGMAAATENSTHYEILNLPHTATTSEIKRRYYELSKAHHPDRNPNDPDASSRFARISDAYGIIGNTIKREKYDRELGRRHGIRHTRPTGPAGGRPASGLSRRRTQFHGPPPSFYKSSMLGSTGRSAGSTQGASTSSVGGIGLSGAPTGRNDDVPHFNFEKHRLQQERRRRPIKTTQFEFATSGIIVPLVGVGSLVIVAIAISSRDARAVETTRKQNNNTP